MPAIEPEPAAASVVAVSMVLSVAVVASAFSLLQLLNSNAEQRVARKKVVFFMGLDGL
ncbi:hypothetical protein [Hymenobacter sp. APR13]|uniref:hypothetical protein n=1 Tax=Hymenobacter sp. APR13 TaxID=1356852 RepID=UPI0018CF6BD6|nr:hypothetical protein [Hymenobacter sp. APR13]